MLSRLSWTSPNEFHVAGVRFFATIEASEYHSLTSTDDRFLIVKNREMIEQELSIAAPANPKRIVDLGIWQGGSVALFDLLFQPEKLIALELVKRDLPLLDRYIASNRRQDAVKVHHWVDQGDALRMGRIIGREFGDAPLDLVIDDASHQYEETRTSFNLLFPRLAPGRPFILEDWHWSTRPDFYDTDYFRGKAGLANLVVQCMVLGAVRPDIIASVLVLPRLAVITRGPALIEAGFDVAALALNRGAPVPLSL